MNRILSKYINKLFFNKWVIGICRDDIKNIIRNKFFDPDIDWLYGKSFDKFYADPFILVSENGNYKVLCEDFTYDDNYGKISLLTFDKSLRQVNHKILLDTKSHLSYPFTFAEDNRIYVFPEASESGRLSCYEYDPLNESLRFLQDILGLPLRDSTILKHNDKYWLFGTIIEKDNEHTLNIFYSANLLGPYIPHADNPVKCGLNGNRSAGNFIEVDNIIYRPSQNSEKVYGESITISKVIELDEMNFIEEPYLTICININNKNNYGMQRIHTINVVDKVIVVDGIYRTFSPIRKFKIFAGNILESHRIRRAEENLVH
jgi:hypothetical protein